MYKIISIMMICFSIEAGVCADLRWSGKDCLFQERVEMGLSYLYPTLYSTFDKKFFYKYNYDDALCAIDLIEGVRTSKEWIPNLRKGEDPFAAPARAYRIAWEVGLHVWKNSDDERVKTLMKEAWEKALLKEDGFTVVQVSAMAVEWDEAYLSEGFWSVVSRSCTSEIVESVCYVFYFHDYMQGMNKLYEERSRLGNAEFKQLLDHARAWIDYNTNPLNFETPPGKLGASPHIVTSTQIRRELTSEEYEEFMEALKK